MNRFTRYLGERCDKCPLCNYARQNPHTWFGKLMKVHGMWCPAWKAQKKIEAERQAAQK